MSELRYPRLDRIASTLAANHARVAICAETLSAEIDNLLGALASNDWRRLEQVSRDMAETCRQNGYQGVSRLAESVSDEVAKPNNQLEVKRNLIRLIGTCGRIQRPSHVSRSPRARAND